MVSEEKSCSGCLASEATVGGTIDNDDVARTAGVNFKKTARGHNTWSLHSN